MIFDHTRNTTIVVDGETRERHVGGNWLAVGTLEPKMAERLDRIADTLFPTEDCPECALLAALVFQSGWHGALDLAHSQLGLPRLPTKVPHELTQELAGGAAFVDYSIAAGFGQDPASPQEGTAA